MIINADSVGSSNFSLSISKFGMKTSSYSFKDSCLLLKCFSLAVSVKESGNLTAENSFKFNPHKSAAWVEKTPILVILDVAFKIVLSFELAIGHYQGLFKLGCVISLEQTWSALVQGLMSRNLVFFIF